MDSKNSRPPGWDRWTALAAAMVMEACGGLGYTFGVYSQHLKERLGYDQEGLDDLGAGKDFGYGFGILGGILYNLTPPWLTISLGALFHFSGYFMVYMTSSGRIKPPFLIICGFLALGTGGDSWLDTAAIMTSVQNFTDYRGTALGVLKAQVGLSGAIFMTLYKAFLKPNVDGYVLLVAVAPAIITAVLAVFVRPFPSRESVDPTADGRFRMAYGGTIFLGVYLLFSISIQTLGNVARPWLIFFAVTMLVQFSLICSILICYKPARRLFDYMMGGTAEYSNGEEMMATPSLNFRHSDISSANVRSEEDSQLLKAEALDSQEDSQNHAVSSPSQMLPERQGYYNLEPLSDEASKGTQSASNKETSVEQSETESHTLWQCVGTTNFWILCLVAVTGPGCGLAIINNFGQMGRSLKSESVELYVGLISLASCFGRLGAGYGSDVLLKFTSYPRPMCLSFAHLIMTLGCLILAVGYVPLLYLGSVLVGGSYGAFWALTPAIIAEVFGIRNFPALYKIIGTFSPLGAYVLSAKIVGEFYDKEAEYYRKRPGTPFHDEDGDEGDNNCLGRKCFGFSMLVLAVVCLVGASLGIVLSIRTRRVYARLK